MATDRDDFVLGFQADLTGIREYLAAMGTAEDKIKQITRRLGNLQFDGNIAGLQGKRLAQTVLNSFENEMRGNNSFERTFLTAVRRLGSAQQQARRAVPPPPPPPRGPSSPGSTSSGDSDPRDAEIKALSERFVELNKEHLTRQRLARAISEIERGITQQLEKQAAASREIRANLSVEDARSLARQNLISQQVRAKLSPEDTRILAQQHLNREQLRSAEILAGITQSLDRQAAAAREIRANLSVADAQSLADQDLIKKQTRAQLSPEDTRRLAQQALNKDQQRSAEILAGITKSLEDQAAAAREIRSSLSADDARTLARQSVINQQAKAKLTPDESKSLARQNLISQQVRAQLSPEDKRLLAQQSLNREQLRSAEILAGITQSLDRQAAAAREIKANLSVADAESLARQSLIRQQHQARISDEDFALIEQDRLGKSQAVVQQQRARNKGTLIGSAEAASISRDGSTPAEQFFRTARGVTAFTLTSFPLYNAMNLVTQGLREATVGTLEYEDSLAQLGVSLNANTQDIRGFASQAGAIGNSLGLSQADGVRAASRSVGVFGLGGQDPESQQDFIRRALTAAGQINYQSGTTDLIATQQNIAGTLRSFGLANDQIEQVADGASVISKRFGIISSDLLDTTAQIGTQAQAAGFSLQQTQAILANQAANTGESPGTVAGAFSQVLAQADNPAIANRLRSLGINTDNTTLAQQIEQLAGLVAKGQIDQSRLNSISAAFGKGRSGQAFQILVRDFARTQSVADEAKNSPGISRDIFNKLFNNISAEFRQLVGNVRGIITELAQSGLLDFLGGLLVVTQEVTGVIYELLQVFNQLPRPLRTSAFLFLEIAGAMALINRYGGVAKILTSVGGALQSTFNVFRTAQVAAAQQGAAAAAGSAAAVGGAAVGGQLASSVGAGDLASIVRAGPGTSALSGIRASAAQGLALIGGPAGAAVIVTALVGAGVFKAITAQNETERAINRADAAGNNAGTADELRAAAAAQREAAQKAREEQRGGLDLRTIGTLGLAQLYANTIGPQEGQVEEAKRRAAELEADAKRLDVQAAATRGTPAAFGSFESAETVQRALSDLDAAGYSTSEQLSLVTRAMDELTQKAGTSAAAIIGEGQRSKFTSAFGTVATRSIQDGINQADLRRQVTEGTFLNNLSFLNPFGGKTDTSKAKDDLQTLRNIDTSKLRQDAIANVESYLNSIGKTGDGAQSLSAEELKGLEDAQYKFLRSKIDPQIKGLPEQIQKSIINSIRLYTKRDIEGQFGTAANGATISPETIQNELNTAQAVIDKRFQDLSRYSKLGANTNRRDALKAAIATAKTQQKSLTGDAYDEAGRFIAQAQDELISINYDLTKQLAAYAAGKKQLNVARTKGDDSAARLRAQLAGIRGQRAATSDEEELLQLDLQIADLLNQQRTANLDLLTAQSQAKRDSRNRTGQAKDAVADARRRLSNARTFGGALEIAQAQTALNEALQQQRDIALSLSKARAASQLQPGDIVAAAKLALSNARADKDAALRGTEEYYNALVAIAEARKQVADAQNQRRYNKDLLGIDLTDPVAQANAELRDARRRLRDAVGPDERDQARIDLRNKQNSAEAAAFNQRLSDVQTAEELGRISHEAYISYLQNEHNRLSAIKNRTRQQQDQLDQVDKLMKSAADQLNGQFNIGNIKLPTIYEVRRAIAEGSGGVKGVSSISGSNARVASTIDNSVRTLNIHGVPLQEVYKYIQSVVGANVTKTSATGGR